MCKCTIYVIWNHLTALSKIKDVNWACIERMALFIYMFFFNLKVTLPKNELLHYLFPTAFSRYSQFIFFSINNTALIYCDINNTLGIYYTIMDLSAIGYYEIFTKWCQYWPRPYSMKEKSITVVLYAWQLKWLIVFSFYGFLIKTVKQTTACHSPLFSLWLLCLTTINVHVKCFPCCDRCRKVSTKWQRERQTLLFPQILDNIKNVQWNEHVNFQIMFT